MSTVYPGALDALVNPSSTDTTAAVDHAQQHSNANDAIEALEAKLGIGSSVAASGKLLRGTGAGASAWDKDAPAGTIVGTTDSQTLANKTLTSPTLNTPIINNPTLNTNTISEFTSAAGVTVDGLLLKDGKLATNNSVVTSNITDDAVTAAKIDWAATGANAGIWWEELGRTTLGANADTLSISSFSARKYMRLMVSMVNTGGAVRVLLQFNGDTAANYAQRDYDNDTASTATSATSINLLSNADTPCYIVADIENIAGKEKLVIAQLTARSTAGAAAAPSIKYIAGKWSNTAAQISTITISNNSTGDFATTTQIVLLGHN